MTSESNSLLGDWRPIKSEIPDFDLDSELLHFQKDGVFLWEHPKYENQPTVAKLKYWTEGAKLHYTTFTGPTWVDYWFEDETLILRPLHGYKTHWKKY